MKKYQVWAITDVAILAISVIVGIFAGIKSATIFRMGYAIVIGFAVVIAVDFLLGKWYYSGVSKEEKFFHGDDEY